MGDSEVELDRLRRTLQEAERDIWSKQEEIEILKRKLDYSVTELSDTETVLSSNLQDLENERAKFSTSPEDWSRRVNAVEKQLRETIRRLDEREKELMDERSSDQQKLREPQQHQQRRSDAPADKTDIIVSQLQLKLVESEAQIAALTQRLQEMESSSSHSSTDTTRTASSTASVNADDQVEGAKKLMVNDDEQNELLARLESLHHHCHDTNRRLLATLRIQTESVQAMIEAKMTAVNNASNRTAIAAELQELSDDLVVVHQYITDIDRHLQSTEKTSPNEFMKDFNFKDVLNRLAEVEGRFTSLLKRDDTMSMVREPTAAMCLENGSAVKSARIPNSMHEMHENEGPKPVALSSTNKIPEPAVPFSTYWDYSVSPLHADLARSLASYLERKYNDSTRCTVLTSEDFRSILTETMALEACLLTEIANIIEASKNEERLRLAVKLRDVRNAYVVLRRLDDFLKDAGDDRRVLALLENRLDVNSFNILCEETKHFVSAHLNELMATLPSNWREKLNFGPADADARVAALKVLSKNLLRDLIVFEPNQEEATSCSMELLRSTILKDEITHILSRVETNMDTFDSDTASSNWAGGTESVIAEAAHSTVSLCDQLMAKIDSLLANFLGADDSGHDFAEDQEAAEQVQSRLAGFLKHLKQTGSSNATAPLGATSAKMAHMDGAFLKEMNEIGASVKIRENDDLPVLASLISARATVRGYRSWIEATYGAELNTCARNTNAVLDFRQCPSETEFEKFLTSGSKLAECVAHYEPLTRQLFYRILSNIGTKLVAVQLSVFYECRMRDMAAAQESLLQRALEGQQCEWCGSRRSAGRDSGVLADGDSDGFTVCTAPQLRSKVLLS